MQLSFILTDFFVILFLRISSVAAVIVIVKLTGYLFHWLFRFLDRWFSVFPSWKKIQFLQFQVNFTFTNAKQKQPPKGVHRNFTKFTEIHLCQSFFFNKVAALRPKKETLAQVFSCEFFEISKNTFFTEHLRTTASGFWNKIKFTWIFLKNFAWFSLNHF